MQKDSELFLFVGSYADATDPGINLFRFDVEKGTAVPVKSLSGIQDPSYLTVSRDGKFVYSVSEILCRTRKYVPIRLINIPGHFPC